MSAAQEKQQTGRWMDRGVKGEWAKMVRKKPEVIAVVARMGVGFRHPGWISARW